MLIGFPTQKGFIAYRKPEIGSWYMNAIVQIFSKHARDTDLCAMLNMVNSLISNEVTNTGKKQMSEYTSKLTKPYFYFFPGLATDDDEETESVETETTQTTATTANTANGKVLQPLKDNNDSMAKKLKSGTDCHSYEDQLDQSDSHNQSQRNTNTNKQKIRLAAKINDAHIDFIADKARFYWKHIAREINLTEMQISEIDRSFLALNNNVQQLKLKNALNVWLNNSMTMNGNDENDVSFQRISSVLAACRLNKIKEEFLTRFS